MTATDPAGYSMERIMRILTFAMRIWLTYIICLACIPASIMDMYLLTEDTAMAVLSSSDSDGDGLPDWWENRYGGNPAPASDSDGDGVSNLNEYNNGTHPLETDTDGDGTSDYEEIYRYRTDPLLADTDRGGSSDTYEISSGGNPLNPDDDDNPGKNFAISLKSGWNMFSLPVNPANTAVASVLSSLSGKYISVWSYQGGTWKTYDAQFPPASDLENIESGLGYWIEMKEAAVLNVSGTSPSRTLSLTAGWNLVGYNSGTSQKIENAFSSLTGKITAVWTFTGGDWKLFDPVTPPFSNLYIIEPGQGYWILAAESCTWTLP